MERRFPDMPAAGVLILFVIRSFLLWALVPLASVVWVCGCLWFARRGSLRKFVRWTDYNATTALCRSVFRPLMRMPLPVYAPLATVGEFNTPISFIAEFA